MPVYPGIVIANLSLIGIYQVQQMEQFENLARNYSQAPWRKQLQVIALFLLLVVLTAMIAVVYLNISARATAVGRDIQVMQTDIENLNRENEDLQSQLAKIRSSSQMEARARTLGFIEIPPDQIVYLDVPGYFERKPVLLAPSQERTVVGAVYVPPEYTESLFDWLYRVAREWYEKMSEELP